MPYIPKKDRDKVFLDLEIDTPGELNYALTGIIQSYIGTRKLSYILMNDILGALEGAKLEFYRRIVVPYEDEKIKENGDVY